MPHLGLGLTDRNIEVFVVPPQPDGHMFAILFDM